jgi:hypothetical protein
MGHGRVTDAHLFPHPHHVSVDELHLADVLGRIVSKKESEHRVRPTTAGGRFPPVLDPDDGDCLFNSGILGIPSTRSLWNGQYKHNKTYQDIYNRAVAGGGAGGADKNKMIRWHTRPHEHASTHTWLRGMLADAGNSMRCCGTRDIGDTGYCVWRCMVARDGVWRCVTSRGQRCACEPGAGLQLRSGRDSAHRTPGLR